MSNYSHQNFAGHDLTDRPASDFTGTTITGSCFSRESPDSVVFPAGVSDMTFIDCNLDNVLLPPASIVQGGCARRWMAIDGVDTLVDENNNPIGPL